MTLARRHAALRMTVAAAILIAAIAPAAADPARSRAAGSKVAPVMAWELAGLQAAHAARAAAVARAERPAARSDADVTVASRSVSPGGGLFGAARKGTPTKLDLQTLDALPAGKGDAEWRCLAEAIYFEARGEPLSGQVAVAEVVLNRVEDPSFPDTVCGVTKQGVGSGRGCQFSYACDGLPESMRSALARSRSEKLASLMLAGQPRTLSEGAVYFHTRAIRPHWARHMTRTTTIGHHMFYRDPSAGKIASR